MVPRLPMSVLRQMTRESARIALDPMIRSDEEAASPPPAPTQEIVPSAVPGQPVFAPQPAGPLAPPQAPVPVPPGGGFTPQPAPAAPARTAVPSAGLLGSNPMDILRNMEIAQRLGMGG